MGIISIGSADQAVEEARCQLDSAGLQTDYLRVRAAPFTEEVEQFVRDHDRVYVVELNRDGQLYQLLMINLPTDLHSKLRKAAHSDGMPLSARWVREEIGVAEGVLARGEAVKCRPAEESREED